MHSRIFQVDSKPINKEDYIEESTYWDHWFVNSIADYVNDNCDRNDDIQWLKDCAKGYSIGCDENGEYLIIENKEEYFKNSFERFKELLDKIKDSTIQDFTKGIFEMYGLKNAYEEKFGFYMETDGYGLITMDSFIRDFPEDVKFYIGGTIDYHC